MSNRYWSKWGDDDGQTVGYDPELPVYYVKAEGIQIGIWPRELDDLIYQLMRLKRKVEND